MLRANLLKGLTAARSYSTTPTPAALSIEDQLDKLLARVNALGNKPAGNGNNNKSNNRGKMNSRKTPQTYAKQVQTQKRQTQQQRQPQQQQQAPRPKVSEATNELGELFASTSDSFKTFTPSKSTPNKRPQQPRFTSKQRRQQTSSSSSNSSRTGSSSQRRNTRNKRTSSRDSTSITNNALPTKNPNFDAIATSYSPEELSLTDLMLRSPLTSQTQSSRLIKAYQRLAIDSKADVSGILTGKFDNEITSSSEILSQLKTPALKLNGEAVVNSLNSNGSIDVETKIKLLKPLIGLAPVKELNA